MRHLQEHKINNRILNTVHSIDEALHIHPDKNYLFDLSYQGIVQVTGEKSLEFLQGQLTCDMNLLSDIQMVQGAQCNLKGRILSMLDLIKWNNIQIIFPKDLIEMTIHSLRNTAQLARVTLKEDSQWTILGFYLQNDQNLLPDTTFFPNQKHAFCKQSSFCYYHLGNGFYVFILSKNQAVELIDLFFKHEQFLGSLTWHTLRLMNQHLEIYPESRGLFLPHRIALHKTSYISFNKGCYKGQEIIARTHYKATLKHELKLFSVQSNQSLVSGQRLFRDQTEIEIGEIIDYSLLGTNQYLIAASLLKEPVETVLLEGQNTPITLKPID